MFLDYGKPLEIMMYLKYPGRLIPATQNDWPEFIVNIQKLQKS